MSSILDKLKGIIGSLVGIPTLPKTVRNTLKKYGETDIVSIVIHRVPISGVAEGMLSAITLGKWKEIRQNYDDIFHLFASLRLRSGQTLLLEKNETVVLKEGAPPLTKETQSVKVRMSGPIPLGGFIEKTVRRMGVSDYTTYNAFSLNCQNFLMNHLEANGLMTPQLKGFVYQDTKELIEKTPSFSQWLGKKITDIAGKGRELWEEVAYKRGGKVRRIGRL
jgi:hypothetical protein